MLNLLRAEGKDAPRVVVVVVLMVVVFINFLSHQCVMQQILSAPCKQIPQVLRTHTARTQSHASPTLTLPLSTTSCKKKQKKNVFFFPGVFEGVSIFLFFFIYFFYLRSNWDHKHSSGDEPKWRCHISSLGCCASNLGTLHQLSFLAEAGTNTIYFIYLFSHFVSQVNVIGDRASSRPSVLHK